VVDENNIPLIGAVVKLEGIAIGNKIDMDGRFILQKMPFGLYTILVIYVSFEKKV
jgi:hypothetical protein